MRKRRERELEESEARLRASEDRLQLAVEAAELGIWDWDVEQDRLVWDDSMYRLYGVRKEEFSGAYDAWCRCLVPEDIARATADVQAALRGDREYRCRLQDTASRRGHPRHSRRGADHPRRGRPARAHGRRQLGRDGSAQRGARARAARPRPGGPREGVAAAPCRGPPAAARSSLQPRVARGARGAHSPRLAVSGMLRGPDRLRRPRSRKPRLARLAVDAVHGLRDERRQRPHRSGVPRRTPRVGRRAVPPRGTGVARLVGRDAGRISGAAQAPGAPRSARGETARPSCAPPRRPRRAPAGRRAPSWPTCRTRSARR